MVSAQWIPLADANVICRLTDDGAVLVSPEAGDLRVLNAVGAAVWQLLDGQHTVGELESELVRRFGISASQARDDIANFLDDLQRRGLLSWVGPAGSPAAAS